MRKHLYRGKRKDNGEWVYGYFRYLADIPVIYPKPDDNRVVTAPVEVDPETVGEFTGLTDKNDMNIFEGDIVSFVHDESFGRPYKITRNYEVQFVNLFSQYGLRLKNKNIHFPFKQSTASMHDVEVIGNIHDNPELLEVGK